MTDAERVMLIETKTATNENTRRLSVLEKDVKKMKDDTRAMYKIAASVEIVAEKIGNIDGKVDNINREIGEMKEAQRKTEKELSLVKYEPAVKKANRLTGFGVKVIETTIAFLVTGGLGAIIYFASITK